MAPFETHFLGRSSLSLSAIFTLCATNARYKRRHIPARLMGSLKWRSVSNFAVCFRKRSLSSKNSLFHWYQTQKEHYKTRRLAPRTQWRGDLLKTPRPIWYSRFILRDNLETFVEERGRKRAHWESNSLRIADFSTNTHIEMKKEKTKETENRLRRKLSPGCRHSESRVQLITLSWIHMPLQWTSIAK